MISKLAITVAQEKFPVRAVISSRTLFHRIDYVVHGPCSMCWSQGEHGHKTACKTLSRSLSHAVSSASAFSNHLTSCHLALRFCPLVCSLSLDNHGEFCHPYFQTRLRFVLFDCSKEYDFLMLSVVLSSFLINLPIGAGFRPFQQRFSLSLLLVLSAHLQSVMEAPERPLSSRLVPFCHLTRLCPDLSNIQRHLTGEFEKKYIGMFQSLRSFRVFP